MMPRGEIPHGLMLSLVFYLVFGGSTALAEEADADIAGFEEDAIGALSLWDQAREAIGLGELERALGLLTRSYETQPTGLTAYELGRVHRRLGRRAEAVRWLRLCAADEALPTDVRERAENEARAIDDRQGALLLADLPHDTRVVVDGELREPIGDERRVPLATGPHRVVLIEASGATTRLQLDIAPHEDITLPSDGRDESEPAAPSRRRYRALMTSLWVSLGLSVALAAGTGLAIGFDANLSGLGDPGADQARLASGILGGLTGIGLTVVLALIPYVVNLRRSLRESNRSLAPSRNP